MTVVIAFAATPLFAVSNLVGWTVVVALLAGVLAVAYLAFGQAALGLPTWIAVLAVLALLNVPWSMTGRLIGAVVAVFVVFLVIGFAMLLRSQPPGRSEPPETAPPPHEPRN